MIHGEHSIGAFEAKTHFSRVLDRVEQGETILITRHGHTIAKLVPIKNENRERAKEAMRRISDRRGRLKTASLQDLIETIHEGHQYP